MKLPSLVLVLFIFPGANIFSQENENSPDRPDYLFIFSNTENPSYAGYTGKTRISLSYANEWPGSELFPGTITGGIDLAMGKKKRIGMGFFSSYSNDLNNSSMHLNFTLSTHMKLGDDLKVHGGLKVIDYHYFNSHLALDEFKTWNVDYLALEFVDLKNDLLGLSMGYWVTYKSSFAGISLSNLISFGNILVAESYHYTTAQTTIRPAFNVVGGYHIPLKEEVWFTPVLSVKKEQNNYGIFSPGFLFNLHQKNIIGLFYSDFRHAVVSYSTRLFDEMLVGLQFSIPTNELWQQYKVSSLRVNAQYIF